ncbi:MAG: diguanylate cyclase [Planctomycetota bacterium]
MDKSKWLCAAAAVALMAVVGFGDSLIGFRVNWSAFYLLPIMWVTLHFGRWPALATAYASIAVGLALHFHAASAGGTLHILAANALVSLGIFVFVIRLQLALKKAWSNESELARTDRLTGVANRLAFREAADQELSRARRHHRPFTLAYIDLDDFKTVNDRFGHDAGDALLREVAGAMQRHVRLSDFVARLGGDEFAILFPETEHAAAGEVLGRITNVLQEAMRQDGKHVTLSVGAVTFTSVPPSLDAMIKCADDLMYNVKRNGKNSVAQAVYSESAQAGN